MFNPDLIYNYLLLCHFFKSEAIILINISVALKMCFRNHLFDVYDVYSWRKKTSICLIFSQFHTILFSE